MESYASLKLCDLCFVSIMRFLIMRFGYLQVYYIYTGAAHTTIMRFLIMRFAKNAHNCITKTTA